MFHRVASVFLLVGVSLAVVGCATVDQQSPQTGGQLESMRVQLRRSSVDIHKGNFKYANEELKKVLASGAFDRLTEEEQHWAVYSSGFVAFRLADWQRAISFFKRSSAMPLADGKDWIYRLSLAQWSKDTADANLCISTILQHWPEEIPNMDVNLVSLGYRELAKDLDEDSQFKIQNAIFNAYEKNNAFLEPEWLWMDLIQALVKRGEIARARLVSSHLHRPHFLVSMSIDKQFDAVVMAEPERFDIKRAADLYVDFWRSRVKLRPRNTDSRVQLMSALLTAVRFEDALQESEDVEMSIRNSAPGYPVFDDMSRLNWITEYRARALRVLGRWQEAIDVEVEASKLPEHGSPNVSQVINLAYQLCAIGKPAQALDVLERNDQGPKSDYGLMAMQLVRHWAAVQIGDTQAAETALAYMREHKDDQINAFQRALVTAKRLDEAAQLMTLRLSDPKRRTPALMQLQSFKQGLLPLEERNQDMAWSEFSKRPDVQAAASAVGRVKHFEIGATSE